MQLEPNLNIYARFTKQHVAFLQKSQIRQNIYLADCRFYEIFPIFPYLNLKSSYFIDPVYLSALPDDT